MRFDPKLAAVRFGTGLSPNHAPPASVEELVASVDGKIEKDWPFLQFPDMQSTFEAFFEQRRMRRKLRNGPEDKREENKLALHATTQQLSDWRKQTFRHLLARGAYDRTGFSTRLMLFWADHFTVKPKGQVWHALGGDYLDTAIRPNVLGKFEAMLTDVVTHPLMLQYLDQVRSVGPNSTQGKRTRGQGVNENLARELLELHTLGVDGSYTQKDVHSLALLLTGLAANAAVGFSWNRRISEPGAHTVLGKSYGDAKPDLERVLAFLKDIAVHPETAQHLARKMAKHFVSDTPSDDLVASMAEGFGDKGDLNAMTQAMLRHPDSWNAEGGNVKWGIEYMVGVMRAMDMSPKRLTNMKYRKFNRLFGRPLTAMGQGFFAPNGPDGLDEDDGALMSPQSLAARLEWAIRAPDLMGRGLPDPRRILPHVLPHSVPKPLDFAVNAAESRQEGLALLFVSPAFQRR